MPDPDVEQLDLWLNELDGYIGSVERSRSTSAEPFHITVDGRIYLTEEQATKLEDIWDAQKEDNGSHNGSQ